LEPVPVPTSQSANFLIAIEPSWQLIQQRSRDTSPVVQAVAEALPFRVGTFDVAFAVLTLHHWVDWRLGLAEMKRVAGRVVLFTFDPSALDEFWLTETYFPESSNSTGGGVRR
jgi:ubiquinone/menaquinone biosynthesis C-methylase UbiE